MKYDELAFANMQLAGMLKSGIPLEGALRQLSRTMRRGKLQGEFESLERDLAGGMPLSEALALRRLPDFYRRMVEIGARGNDLPGILIRLADHYQRASSIGARLTGLMVYPAIVVVASLALSIFLALFFGALNRDMPAFLPETTGADWGTGPGTLALLWMPVVLLSSLGMLAFVALVLPPFRRWLRWHLPGFKEAGLAQLASTMRLMLSAGTNLGDALGLLYYLEMQTPAGRDVALWQSRLSQGHGRFPAIAAGSRVVPPLFSWLVDSGDEDMSEGFRRAAEIYEARAGYRVEVLLYAALPVSILFLGVILVSQAYPVVRLFLQFGSILEQLGR
jgi:type II secretory pathway component PulF